MESRVENRESMSCGMEDGRDGRDGKDGREGGGWKRRGRVERMRAPNDFFDAT